MHQTSSRLLRMTEDERPFTRVCAAYNLFFARLVDWFSNENLGLQGPLLYADGQSPTKHSQGAIQIILLHIHL